jgi:hypothetical protein
MKKLRPRIRGTQTQASLMVPDHATDLNMEAITERLSDERTSKRSSDET